MKLKYMHTKMKFSLFSLLILSVILFSFQACSFFAENIIEEKSNETSLAANKDNQLTLNITPYFEGQTASDRSAYPTFTTDTLKDFTYTVYSSTIPETTGTYNTTSGKITFTIACQAFTSEEITVSAKQDNNVLFTATSTISYSVGQSKELSLNFQRDDSSAAKGNVALKIAIPTGYDLTVDVMNEKTNTVVSTGASTGVSSTRPLYISQNSSTCTIKTTDFEIAAGDYKARMYLYKNSELRSLIIQTITVWPGLTTNQWYLADGSKNQEYPLAANANYSIYVRGTGGDLYDGGYITGATPGDDGNTGNILKPVASLQAAINKCTDSSADYTIYLDGSIDDAIVIDGNDANASMAYNSLTIKGISGPAKDIINRDTSNGDGSVIKIDKGVSLVFDGIKITGGNTSDSGGGINIFDANATVTLKDCVIAGNQADQNGGGISNRGTCYIYGSTVVGNGNATTAISSLGAGSNQASKHGGGIFNKNKLYLGYSSYTSDFVNKKAFLSGGVYANAAYGNGGGIYNEGGTIVIASGKVAYNFASGYVGENPGGGGICSAYTGASVTMGGNSSVYKNRITSGNGGGVRVEGGEFNLTESASITYNEASGGAGLYCTESTVNLKDNSLVDHNSSSGWGGGIFIQKNGSKLTIADNAAITNNTGTEGGGIQAVDAVCTIEMSGGLISGNSGSDGGGVRLYGGTLIMSGGEISNNTSSSGTGGGVSVKNDSVFKISGSAYIPAGDSNDNDVYLDSGNTIQIVDTLNPPEGEKTASIIPFKYESGYTVLSGTMLNTNYGKVRLIPDPASTKNWVINSTGELVLPFRIIVNDSELYLDKSSFVTAISNSSLSSQNVKIQILEMDADDFGPAGNSGTVLHAILLSPANQTSLIVDEDANIKLPADSSNYFSALSKVVEMDLRGLDTSNVTTMKNMFYVCNNLESLNLSSFNTSKVTNMQTFLYSNKIKSLDLSSFDTSNVTNMEQMIAMCDNITSLDISNFNTSKVTNMKQMFYSDGALKTIYVSSDFVVDQVTASGNMFQYCTSLTGGKGTNISNGILIDKTFARIDNPPDNPGYFTQGPVKKENLVSYITSMTESGIVFLPSNTDAAVIEDVKGALQTLYTNKPEIEVDLDLRLIRLTEIPASAFSGCGNIASIHLPSTIISFDSSAFSSCSKLKNVYVEGMKVDDWANINFENYSANPCNNGADLYLRGTKVQYAFFDTATKINAYAFYGCTSIDSFELPVELKEIGNSAFAKCPNLTNVSDMTAVTTFGNSIFDSSGMNFTSLSTSQITEIPTEMFYRCNSLTSVNLGSGITKLGEAAFGYCNNLASITIPNTVTSIGKNQFLYSPKDIDIYYDGTQEQWNSIAESNWNYGHNNMKKITVHFNDDTINDTY